MVDTNRLTFPERLLFRTRNDTRPSGSNWARAWHPALESVGQQPLRVYDCRHAVATTCYAPACSIYVGAPDDEEHTAYQRIDTYLETTEPIHQDDGVQTPE